MSAGGRGGGGYDARVWQPHVLAHLPLYGVLVPLAAEAAAARVRARGPEPAATLLKVRQSEPHQCWLRRSADGSAGWSARRSGTRSGCSSVDLSITDWSPQHGVSQSIMLCQPQSACGVHSVCEIPCCPHATKNVHCKPCDRFCVGFGQADSLLASLCIGCRQADSLLANVAGAGGVSRGAGADGHAGGSGGGGSSVRRLWRRHDPLGERSLHHFVACTLG
jgi:hypothetical protein